MSDLSSSTVVRSTACLTPVKEPTPELLSMTQPTVFEVMIAIVGGIAGVIGQTRKDRVNTIIPKDMIMNTLLLLIPAVIVSFYKLLA